MKKTISLIIACVFVAMCVTLFAGAEDTSVKGTFSGAEAKAGDTVTVSLSIDANTAIQSIGFSGLSYDKSALEYQSAEWTLSGGSGKIMDSNKDAIAGVYAFEGADKEVSGKVLSVNFKVIDGAKDGVYSVSCSLSAGKVDGAKPATNLVPGAVTVKSETPPTTTEPPKSSDPTTTTEAPKSSDPTTTTEAPKSTDPTTTTQPPQNGGNKGGNGGTTTSIPRTGDAGISTVVAVAVIAFGAATVAIVSKKKNDE